MNGLVIKPLSRFLALFLALTLTFPNPAFGLREQAIKEKGRALAGLEEALQDPVQAAQRFANGFLGLAPTPVLAAGAEEEGAGSAGKKFTRRALLAGGVGVAIGAAAGFLARPLVDRPTSSEESAETKPAEAPEIGPDVLHPSQVGVQSVWLTDEELRLVLTRVPDGSRATVWRGYEREKKSLFSSETYVVWGYIGDVVIRDGLVIFRNPVDTFDSRFRAGRLLVVLANSDRAMRSFHKYAGNLFSVDLLNELMRDKEFVPWAGLTVIEITGTNSAKILNPRSGLEEGVKAGQAVDPVFQRILKELAPFSMPPWSSSVWGQGSGARREGNQLTLGVDLARGGLEEFQRQADSRAALVNALTRFYAPIAQASGQPLSGEAIRSGLEERLPRRRFLATTLPVLAAIVLEGCGGKRRTTPEPPTSQPPVITAPPVNASKNVGQNVSFTVGLASNPLTPTFQWKKGTTNLVNGGNIGGAASQTLTISSVQVADAGTYSVVVTNSAGVVTSAPATLTVNQLPLPEPQPEFRPFDFLERQERAGLLVTFAFPEDSADPLAPILRGRSYTFGNAVGDLARLFHMDKEGAKQILLALQSYVEDGQIGTFFDTHAVQRAIGGRRSHTVTNSMEEDRRLILRSLLQKGAEVFNPVRSGNVAWVGYAMTLYELETEDATFRDTAVEMADFLRSLKDSESGLIRGGPDVRWISTEHNLDFYFFLKALARVTGQAQYDEEAKALAEAIERHLFENGHFIQGRNDRILPLDVQYLGALFLLERGDEGRANQVRDFIERTFLVTVDISPTEKLTGYKAFQRDPNFVWAEGTALVRLLDLRLDRLASAGRLERELLKMVGPTGGLRDAIPRTVSPDAGGTFLDVETVAATSLFELSRLNPANFLAAAGAEERERVPDGWPQLQSWITGRGGVAQLAPAQIGSVSRSLRGWVVSPDVDVAMRAGRFRVEMETELIQSALSEIRGAQGSWTPLDTLVPQVFLLEGKNTPWAPFLAQAKAPVGVIVESAFQAQGMNMLFKGLGVPEERYKVVSLDVEIDRDSALKAIRQHFQRPGLPAVEWVTLPDEASAEEIEKTLRGYGFQFFTSPTSRLIFVARYLGGLA